MKILIYHALFDFAGGGEKLTLELARALEQLGHELTIMTFYRDYNAFKRSFELLSQDYKPRVEARMAPLTTKLFDMILEERFVRLKRQILTKRFLKEIKHAQFDLIIDMGSNIPTDVDISYIHYPTIAPGYGSGIIYGLYHHIVRWHARGLVGYPRLILANSSWTAEKVMKFHHISRSKIGVLHPPVEVEYFSKVASNNKREDLIVTLSRFTPEKRLDSIMQAAEMMPNYTFLLIGTAGKYSQPVISRIRKIIKEKGLSNVQLMTNILRPLVREFLGRARFYLHPPYAEHFGIAVGEAMAAGCVPLVYRDGGAWTDMVSRVDEALGYSDISEVPRIVKIFENDRELEKKTRSNAIEIAGEFSFERFKDNLSYYLSRVTV